MIRVILRLIAIVSCFSIWLAFAGLAFAQTIVLEPDGPLQSWPIEPNANRPPITFLPEWAKPPSASGMKSWKAIRDAGVIRQNFDYSCGSAALATLVSAAGISVSEADILQSVFARLDEVSRTRVTNEGLSLLDLKIAVEALGHRAEGYRVGPEILARLDRPVIVYIEPYGYRHFVVLRGVVEDRVFLADPARGNVRLPIWRFLDMWRDETGKGVVFAVDVGRELELVLPKNVDPQPEQAGVRQVIRAVEPRIWPQVAPTRSLLK